MGLFGRGRSSEPEIVLSGYADAAAYLARTPSWEPDQHFGTVEAAVLAAESWRASAGPSSTVEIIQLAEDGGRVVCVVDADGVEHI